MDAVTYIKDKTRMCRKINCKDCNLSHWLNGTEHSCSEFAYLYPEKAIAIVEKWSEEHPQKTMFQDFRDEHPKAPMGAYGTPKTCPSVLGYESIDYCENMEGDIDPATCCVECWNRPLPDK